MTFGMLVANNIVQKQLDDAKKAAANGKITQDMSDELSLFEEANDISAEEKKKLEEELALLNEAYTNEGYPVKVYSTKTEEGNCTKKTVLKDGNQYSTLYYYNKDGDLSKEVVTVNGKEVHRSEYSYDSNGKLKSVTGKGDATYGMVGNEDYNDYKTSNEQQEWSVDFGTYKETYKKENGVVTITRTEENGGETVTTSEDDIASWSVNNGKYTETFVKNGNIIKSVKTENGKITVTITEFDESGSINKKTVQTENTETVYSDYKATGLKTSYRITKTITNNDGSKTVTNGSGKEYFYGAKAEKDDMKISDKLQEFLNFTDSSVDELLQSMETTIKDIKAIHDEIEANKNKYTNNATIDRLYSEIQDYYKQATSAESSLEGYKKNKDSLSASNKKTIKAKINELKEALKKEKEAEEKVKAAAAEEAQKEEAAKKEEETKNKEELEKWDKLIQTIEGMSSAIKNDIRNAIQSIVNQEAQIITAINNLANKDAEIAARLQTLINQITKNNPNDALEKIRKELNSILSKIK